MIDHYAIERAKRWPSWVFCLFLAVCGPVCAQPVSEIGVVVGPPPVYAPQTVFQADQIADAMAVNVHNEYFTAGVYTEPNFTNVILAELQASGLRHIRTGPRAPSGDSPPHKAAFYSRVHAESLFSEIDVVVGPAFNLPDLDVDYAATGNAFRVIEGANEATGPCANIIARQQALYSFVKSDPVLGTFGANLPVVGPSFTVMNPATWFLQGCPTFTGFADVGNWHPYIHGLNPETTVILQSAYLAKTAQMYPSLPRYATEFGYTDALGQHEIPAVSQAIAARYWPRFFMFGVASGWNRIYIHQIADPYTTPTAPNSGYGMIGNDNTLKPAWLAVKALYAYFNDPGPIFTPYPYPITWTGGDNTLQVMQVQKRSGHNLTAIWLGAQGWDDANYVPIDVPPQAVTVSFPFNGGTQSNWVATVWNDDGTTTVTSGQASSPLVLPLTVTDHLMVLETY